MLKHVDNLNRTLNISFQLRIGIHTGQLASGAIGTQHFVLDRWGEALEVASQVMSRCSSGEIQVTQPTYEILRNHPCFFEGGEMLYLRHAGKAVQTYHLTAGRSG